MEKEKNKIRYGLIGKNIDYSFSRAYFTQKFKDLKLENHSYENFDFQDINDLKALLKNKENIKGFNVTIPYKVAVISMLSALDITAQEIGAVNTIKITPTGLKGYNTDYYGFQKAIEPMLKKHHTHALILGSGGASKAVAYVFKRLSISHSFVSRSAKKDHLTYTDLNEEVLAKYTIIVNCTPLGTFPNMDQKPDIPYRHITHKHILFDLIYNPEKTAFLLAGEAQGAEIKNGQKMLALQAEKAWEIWHS